MGLPEFLTYASGVGVVAIVSFIFERMSWYQNLESSVKEYVFFGACVVTALGAFAIKTYVPVEMLEQAAPWFGIIGSIFAYQFLGNAYHKIDKK